MEFLLNTWYMAGWASELGTEIMLPRRLLDQPILMFRDGNGLAHALHDRCPHRFVPLSKGRLIAEKGTVQCGYHGLQFDGSGRCAHNPHGAGTIPSAAKVRAYPLVERHACLWIWMGDAELANPAAIPDFSCMDPETAYLGECYLHVGANYQLETDNILDLSHIQFLHPGTLGSEAVQRGRSQMRQEDNTVWSLRQTENEELPEDGARQFGVPPGMRVDRWIDVRWNPPANMLLFAGAAPTGRPRSEAVGLQVVNPHLFTPETTRTTHYWFGVCMPKTFGPEAAEIVKQVVLGLREPFANEDTPMLEAQQTSIADADFWSLRPVLLESDAAAVRVRRLLDGLIKAERATAA